MSYTMSDEDLANVRELISSARLSSVEVYELAARRTDPAAADDVDDAGTVNIEVQSRVGDSEFGIRLVSTITSPSGEITASIAGEYELDGSANPSPRTIQLFCNEVAIMTIYPYLREAVSSITAKVFGLPLYLPVVERGQISMEVDSESVLSS